MADLPGQAIFEGASWASPWLDTESLKAIEQGGARGLKIISANAQGKMMSTRRRAGSTEEAGESVEALQALGVRHGAEVITVAETQHKDADVQHMRFSLDNSRLEKRARYRSFWSSAPLPKVRGSPRAHKGCAVLLKRDWVAGRAVKCCKRWKHKQGRGLMVAIQQEDRSWLHILSVYAPAQHGKRGSPERAEVEDLAQWVEERLREVNGEQVIVAGDMNAVRRKCDVLQASSPGMTRIKIRYLKFCSGMTTWMYMSVSGENRRKRTPNTRVTRAQMAKAGLTNSMSLLAHPSITWRPQRELRGCRPDVGNQSTHRPVAAILAVEVNGDPPGPAPASRSIQYSKFDARAKIAFGLEFGEDVVEEVQQWAREAQAVGDAFKAGRMSGSEARKKLSQIQVKWEKIITDAMRRLHQTRSRGHARGRNVMQRELVAGCYNSGGQSDSHGTAGGVVYGERSPKAFSMVSGIRCTIK